MRIDALLVGTSGKIYEWHLTANSMFKGYEPWRTLVMTQVMNSTVYCEGEAIGVIKLLSHITINATGEITAQIDKGGWDFECL